MMDIIMVPLSACTLATYFSVDMLLFSGEATGLWTFE